MVKDGKAKTKIKVITVDQLRKFRTKTVHGHAGNVLTMENPDRFRTR